MKQLNAVKEELHVSRAPSNLLCREIENNRILEFCKQAVEQEKTGSLYICGCRGTGMSLSMEKVNKVLVNWAEEELKGMVIAGFLIPGRLCCFYLLLCSNFGCSQKCAGRSNWWPNTYFRKHWGDFMSLPSTCFLDSIHPCQLDRTNGFDAQLKVALLFALPALFGIWLGLSIVVSVLSEVGYGFFAPWVSAFETFRHDDEFNKFVHCIVDGTWGTIKGSYAYGSEL
ncbi:hypothetical protein P3S68_000703 [Capsicum galapagoense]